MSYMWIGWLGLWWIIFCMIYINPADWKMSHAGCCSFLYFIVCVCLFPFWFFLNIIGKSTSVYSYINKVYDWNKHWIGHIMQWCWIVQSLILAYLVEPMIFAVPVQSFLFCIFIMTVKCYHNVSCHTVDKNITVPLMEVRCTNESWMHQC